MISAAFACLSAAFACLSAVPVCPFAKFDVVVVLEVTRSLCGSLTSGCTSWTQLLYFINSFVTIWNIGSTQIQVGLVTYGGSSAVAAFALNQYSNRGDLSSAILSLPYPYGNAPSTMDLSLGLNTMRTSLFAPNNGDRVGVQNFAIVLTNGGMIDTPEVHNEMTLARHAGITVYVVGVSNRANLNDLRNISPGPQQQYFNWFFNNADFSALSNLIVPVSNRMCAAANTDCSQKAIDLVFVLARLSNTSNWNNVVNFIYNLVGGMTIGPQNIQVGMVSFTGFANVDFTISTYSDKNSLLKRIQSLQSDSTSSGLRNIYSGLNKMRTSVFQNGNRVNVPDVAILITDAASNINPQLTLPEALAAQQAGITIYAVGVSSAINATELQMIASLPRLEFNQWWRVPDFGSMAGYEVVAAEKLCQPIYGIHIIIILICRGIANVKLITRG